MHLVVWYTVCMPLYPATIAARDLRSFAFPVVETVRHVETFGFALEQA